MICRRFVLLLIIIITGGMSASAQTVDNLQPVLLQDSVISVPGRDILYYIEAPDEEASAESIWTKRDDFAPVNADTIDFGYQAYPVWVMFKVENMSSEIQSGVISMGRPQLMIAEIHLVDQNTPAELYSAGVF